MSRQEARVAASGSPFGNNLRVCLEEAPPLVASKLNLRAWLDLLGEEEEEEEAQRAAQLYIWLRCGFAFLPSGTVVAPQWRRNYNSALEAASDVTQELLRLVEQGHLLHFDEARRRYASCRHLDRPTIVLAMGMVTKILEDGAKKLRIVLDASGEADGISLNSLIDLDQFPTKLPSVQRYADALAILGPLAKLFKIDLTDSYFSFPISDDSVPLVGIYWNGEFLVYKSLVFGVSSSVHAFQLLAIAVSRAAVRRWRSAGIHCFDPPSLIDQSQPWPTVHPKHGSSVLEPEHETASDIRHAEVTADTDSHAENLFSMVRDALRNQKRSTRTRIAPVELHHDATVRAAFSAPYIDDFAGIAVGPAPSQTLHQRTLDRFVAGVPPLHSCDDCADFCYDSLHLVIAWLGLPANMKVGKSVPPCDEGEILGIGFSCSGQVIFLTAQRVKKLIRTLSSLIAAEYLTAYVLQSIIGLLVFCAIVLPAAKPYLSASLAALRQLGPRPAAFTRLSPDPDMKSDWVMWQRLLLLLNARPISRGVHLPRILAAAFSDASFEGGGYFWGGRWRSWRWPVHWQQHMGPAGGWRITINTLEAIALLVMLRDILPYCGHGRVLHLYLDNTAVKYGVRKLRSRSSPINMVFREVALLLCYWGTVTKSHFVDSKSNECADTLSRTSSLTTTQVSAVVRRWSNAHPDCTHWSRLRPARPELAALLQQERWSYNMLP